MPVPFWLLAMAVISADPAPDTAPDDGPRPLDLRIPNLEVPSETVRPKSSYTLLPVPLVGYDSDNGLNLGVAGALFYNDGVTQPYRFALIGQLLITTVGVSQDYLKMDWLNAFGTGVRVNAEARFLIEPNASFYGIGNLAANAPQGHPQTYYQYDQTNPALRLEARHAIGNDFFFYVGYLFEDVFIHAYPGSLLTVQKPTGWQGGVNAPLQTGLVYDTRDFEPWPRRGMYDEIAVRTAGPLTLGSFAWSGATGILRWYRLLPWDLVLAERFLADVMVGDVPFFDADMTGGIEEMDGLGGFNSMRGFVKDRFMGDGKLLDNLELRRFFYGFDLFKQRFDLGAVLFADVGRVYGDSFADGPPLLFHWDVGAGGRIMLNRDLVIRGDVGVSVEGVRLYILFGNMF